MDIPVTREQPAKMETDEAPAETAAPPSSNENDVNMQDAKGTTDAGAENGSAESEHSVQMETDSKVSTGNSPYYLVWALSIWIIFISQ